MRTSLFLSTLFAVSLLGGSALAEKSQGGAAREPRVVEHVRSHGDTVDKTYRTSATAARPGTSGITPSTRQPTQPKQSLSTQHGADRINCSDTSVDCAASHGAAQVRAADGGSSGAGHARPPAFLDKILGSDRTNFNEAGEDQGMSPRAANRAWSRAATQDHGTSTAMTLGTHTMVDRKSQQASDARMSCNEADECSMSTKAMRKVWAQASIKAGTWTGPAKEPVSNAARRIAAQRAAEGAVVAKADREAARGAAKPEPAREGSDQAH